jgi:hypothetical protein
MAFEPVNPSNGTQLNQAAECQDGGAHFEKPGMHCRPTRSQRQRYHFDKLLPIACDLEESESALKRLLAAGVDLHQYGLQALHT